MSEPCSEWYRGGSHFRSEKSVEAATSPSKHISVKKLVNAGPLLARLRLPARQCNIPSRPRQYHLRGLMPELGHS